MNQSDIIEEAIKQFADKFKKLSEVKIKDPSEDSKKDDQPHIMISFLGMEEAPLNNMNEKIKCLEEDKDGNVNEYFLPPPTMFNLNFMVTPYFKTNNDTMKIMGAIAKLIKEENTIPVGEYDWLENNNMPIYIMPLPNMSMERQMQVFGTLRMEYRPSFFYQLTVGVNSDKKENFRRVEKRDFSTIKKNT